MLKDSNVAHRSNPIAVMAMIFVAVAVLLTLSAGSARATTVAAIWTPDHLLISVDSKMTHICIGCPDPNVVLTGTTCKVIRRGNVVYVPEGFISDSQFDLLRSMNKSGNLSAPWGALAGLKSAIQTDLEGVLPRLRMEDPSRYARYRSGDPMLTLFVGWPQSPKVGLHVIDFVVASESRISVRDVFRSLQTQQTSQVFWEKPNGSTEDPLPRNWFSLDHAKVVRDVVKANILGDKKTNGPPIVVLRITPNGITWEQNQRGECRDDGSTELKFLPAGR